MYFTKNLLSNVLILSISPGYAQKRTEEITEPDVITSEKKGKVLPEFGHRFISVEHRGNIALQLIHDLEWDCTKGKFINYELTNRM